MKRAIQIFAVALIGLLAAGPAWAAVGCAPGSSETGDFCPMGMTQMDADCPMHHALATDCGQDCCNRTVSPAAVVPGIPAKSKILNAAPGIFISIVSASNAVAANSELVSPVVDYSPPRYLLLRVFRI